MPIQWIKAADIEAWTEREPRRAQERLPELVGRLILASANSIIDFHFPHGKAVQYAGYDGYLDISDSGQFFSVGISVWEFGTDKDILRKFNADYTKRSANPGGIEKTETEFCFVSSRIWKHKISIAERTVSAKREGDWRNVRIFDANNLQTWLEQCPSVTVWFSNVLNTPIEGLISLEDYWKKICENTEPVLTAEFFLEGRNSIAQEIVDLFSKGSEQIIVCSDSLLESIVVMASNFILTSNQNTIIRSFFEKCVVIQDGITWRKLSSVYHNNAIFVIVFQPESTLNLSKNKCVYPTNKNSYFNRINKSFNKVEIERQRKEAFEKAFENLGLPWDKIYSLENRSKRRFPALLRLITKDPLLKSPAWTSYGDLSILLPALFSGGWETNKSGYVAIIEQLSSMSWESYTKSLSTFTAKEESPVYCTGDLWICVSISEMWDVLWSYIMPHHYIRFKDCIVAAFAVKNPTYELNQEQWFASSIFGENYIYSDSLLNGLIISLIMLVERNDIENNFEAASVLGDVNYTVRQILDNISDRQGWYTIAPYIPLLSEASPEMVLMKLEEKSQSDDAEFWSMFNPPHDVMTGRAFYSHLLWALENLTWMPEYAARAIHVLACFAEKQFEYKLANSPEDSLVHIFCLWYPQGCLTSDNRWELLQAIIHKYPHTARKLTEQLLSRHTQIITNVSAPHWRDVDTRQHTITKEEYYDQVKQLADLFLTLVQPVFDDWRIILDCLDAFSHKIDYVVERCNEHAKAMAEPDLLMLCQTLAEYISRNRKFTDTDWSADAERLEKLERLLSDITPHSPRKYNYYFSWDFDGLHPIKYNEDTYDIEAEQQSKFLFRREAVRDIIDHFGKNAIFEAVEAAQDTDDLGTIIAEDVLAYEYDWPFILHAIEKNERVAASIIFRIFQERGFDDLVLALPQDDASTVMFVMQSLGIKKEVIEYLRQAGSTVKEKYWHTVRVWGLDPCDHDLIVEVVDNMLAYNRPFSVIDFIAYTEFEDIEVLLTILGKSIERYPNAEPNGKQLNNVPYYKIQKIFTKLYSEKEKYSEQIAKLELVFIMAFDHKFEPQCLIDQLLSDPELFVFFLSLSYKQDTGEAVPKTIDVITRARHANQVLGRIKRIPGAVGSTVDNDSFEAWITKAEALSRTQSYMTAFDVAVGTILSYSPIGRDGVWPCECVRHYLENHHSKHLRNHFAIGLYNQRGVHAMTGGNEEAKIAEKYFSYSCKLEFSYPQTAAIVRRIGTSYQNEVKGEQQREMSDFS